MADGYFRLELDGTDPDELAQDLVDDFQTRVPGWQASDGDPLVRMFAAVAAVLAPRMLAVATVADEIFRLYGEDLVGVPQDQAVSSEGELTVTVVDNSGYTIPAGTQWTTGAGDSTIVWELLADLVVPALSTSAAGTVAAVEPGTQADGVSGAATSVETISYVASATLATTSGGVDTEDLLTYLNRLAAQLQLLTPTAILAGDFEVLARNVAGVERALAIAGYDVTNNLEDQERYVAISAVDVDGAEIDLATQTALVDYLDGLRETNFVAEYLSPTFTPVSVDTTVVVDSEADTAEVEAAVQLELETWLSPANWAGGDQTPPVWTKEDTVALLAAVGVAAKVEDVQYVQSMQLNGGTADITLTGRAPLPSVGTVTVTVVTQ